MIPSWSIGAEEVAQALQHLLDLPEFRRNRNASLFLKFIVEETLSGRGDRLKAFTIATLALQRDDSFDPQNNSIVRVQATRVRQMLEAYYANAGADDPLRIVLPRGSYVPTFVRADGRSVPAMGSAPRAGRGAGRMMGLAVLTLALGLAGGIMIERLAFGGAPQTAGVAALGSGERMFPVVTIDFETSPRPGANGFRPAVLASLRHSFSAFDHLKVAQEAAERAAPDYVLSISELTDSDSADELILNLAHRRTGSIIWTTAIRHLPLSDTRAVLDKITRAVVPDVADTFGVVLADWSSRMMQEARPLNGITCAWAAYGYLRTRLQEGRAPASNCLEDDLRADPDNVTAMNLKALVLLRDYADALPGGDGARSLQRALQLARRAYDRAPYRARSQFVLGMARYFDQRFDDAFSALEQAYGSNPYSSLIRLNLGAAYIARGQMAKGQALLLPDDRTDSGAPGHFASFLALASYVAGDVEQLDRWAMRQSTVATPLGTLMRLLALKQRGDRQACVALWERFRDDYPAYAADIHGALKRNGLLPDLADRLAKDIAQLRILYELIP